MIRTLAPLNCQSKRLVDGNSIALFYPKGYDLPKCMKILFLMHYNQAVGRVMREGPFRDYRLKADSEEDYEFDNQEDEEEDDEESDEEVFNYADMVCWDTDEEALRDPDGILSMDEASRTSA